MSVLQMEVLNWFIADGTFESVHCRWKDGIGLLEMDELQRFMANGRVGWVYCRCKG